MFCSDGYRFEARLGVGVILPTAPLFRADTSRHRCEEIAPSLPAGFASMSTGLDSEWNSISKSRLALNKTSSYPAHHIVFQLFAIERNHRVSQFRERFCPSCLSDGWLSPFDQHRFAAWAWRLELYTCKGIFDRRRTGFETAVCSKVGFVESKGRKIDIDRAISRGRVVVLDQCLRQCELHHLCPLSYPNTKRKKGCSNSSYTIRGYHNSSNNRFKATFSLGLLVGLNTAVIGLAISFPNSSSTLAT